MLGYNRAADGLRSHAERLFLGELAQINLGAGNNRLIHLFEIVSLSCKLFRVDGILAIATWVVQGRMGPTAAGRKRFRGYDIDTLRESVVGRLLCSPILLVIRQAVGTLGEVRMVM